MNYNSTSRLAYDPIGAQIRSVIRPDVLSFD